MRGLLMLCEVALGNSKLYTQAVTTLTQAAAGFHSTHGVGQLTPNSLTPKKTPGGLCLPPPPLGPLCPLLCVPCLCALFVKLADVRRGGG